VPRAETLLNQNYIFSFDAGKQSLCPNFTFHILGPIYVMTLMGFALTIRLLLLLTVTVPMAVPHQHINRGDVFARLNYGVIF